MYRINELIKADRKIYHSNDLAILWKLANKNTLYTTIKRYVQKGILIPIYKGLYSTVPISQLNPLELGRAIIHRYTYLTTESILFQEGMIFQVPYAYTFASSITRKASVGTFTFIFRKLQDKYLFNPIGIIEKENHYIATPERAIADLLYFNPKYHLDLSATVDFEKVRHIQKTIGYPC